MATQSFQVLLPVDRKCYFIREKKKVFADMIKDP